MEEITEDLKKKISIKLNLLNKKRASKTGCSFIFL